MNNYVGRKAGNAANIDVAAERSRIEELSKALAGIESVARAKAAPLRAELAMRKARIRRFNIAKADTGCVDPNDPTLQRVPQSGGDDILIDQNGNRYDWQGYPLK